MNIPLSLEKLGLSSWYWGPDVSTYESLKAGWPAENPELPSEAALENAWLEIKDNVEWAPVRRKRNILLTESDWTQFNDVTIPNKEAWAEYRQKLRDITKDFPSPQDVIWPTEPS